MSRPAIVIFGAAVRPDGSPSGAMRGRVAAALSLGARLDDPLYMPTGGVGRFGPAESTVMAGLLRDGGVPAAQIREEPTGRNTYRSAEACAALLRPLGVRRVYVATSLYHMPRCVWLLRLHGAAAWPGSAAPGRSSRRLARRLYWWLREVPALPADTLFWAAARLRRRS